ncbi:MAG: hypothetical protein IJG13_16915, partial [Kiritimatiellae bacterium]|nr:hypothetical protein [Kiritimatiellia bacterium]
VFGILWKEPNSKGVYLCIAMGVVSGLLLKTCWKGLSWEAGTFVQIGVCFAGFFGGALLGTSKRERESKEELFATLVASATGRLGVSEFGRTSQKAPALQASKTPSSESKDGDL